MTDDQIAKLAQGFWEKLTWAEAEKAMSAATSYKFNVMGFARALEAQLAAAPVAAPADHKQFAIIVDRHYEGEGISLAVWNGENYQLTDGDCYDRDSDTLGVYPAEFLTDYELQSRIAAPIAAQQPMTQAEISDWIITRTWLPVNERNTQYLMQFANEILRRAAPQGEQG